MKAFRLLTYVIVPILALVSSLRADQNIIGNATVTDVGGTTGHNNLTVNGTIDNVGNTFSFGTKSGGAYGAALLFSDTSADTETFNLNRSPGSWLWNVTTTPSMRLTSASSANQLILYQSDGTTAGITLSPATPSLALGTATITASGTNLTTNGSLTLGGTLTGGSTGLSLAAGGTNQNVVFTPSGTGIIDLNGNVGIGTATPASKLQLLGDNVELSMSRATVGEPAYTRLGMTTNFDTYWGTNATFNSSGQWNYVSTLGWSGRASIIDQYNGAIFFDTVSGGTNPITWNTRLYIANAGNIGIGTNAPAYRLDISTPSATASQFHIASTATDAGGYLVSAGDNNMVVSGGVAYAGTGTGFVAKATSYGIMGTTNGTLLFYTGSGATVGNVVTPAERMRVDATGNVGIGTSSPGSKLTVAGQVSVTTGPLLVNPAGDISMGSFTAGTTPQ